MSLIEKLYSRDYYLDDCEGFQEFKKSSGRKLSRRLKKVLHLAAVKAGERAIDLGCGRGEISLQMAKRGAKVFAIDPSPAALNLLKEAKLDWESKEESFLDQLHLLQAEGTALPLKSEGVDLIILSDIVEHLYPNQLRALLRECHRVLKTQGRVVIHTQPNRWLVDWTFPVLRRLSWIWGVSLPKDLRLEMSEGAGPDYHVNELSMFRLKQYLKKANFSVGESWIEGSYPLHRIFGEGKLKEWILNRFRKSNLLKALLGPSIFVLAIKP